MNRPAICVIGPGKVGTALGRLAVRAGYRVAAVGGRDPDRAREAAVAIDPGTLALAPAEAAGLAELLFITVSDAQIEGVAGALAAARAVRPNAIVVHCSGALTSEILEGLRSGPDVALASFHPLQTFPSVESAVTNLPGSHCFLEGDPRALETLASFCVAIGARPVQIDTGAKALYHASAVMACNYLTALMDAALTAIEAAGIERETGWDALAPLVEATLDNVARLGPLDALTGPIQRGDAETVAVHLQALRERTPHLEALYRTLGDWTVGLASRGGTLDADALAALRSALSPRGDTR